MASAHMFVVCSWFPRVESRRKVGERIKYQTSVSLSFCAVDVCFYFGRKNNLSDKMLQRGLGEGWAAIRSLSS